MKYCIYEGDRIVFAPAHEAAIRSYLTSYAGKLERLTVHAAPGGVTLDDDVGISATEWLQDNGGSSQHVLSDRIVRFNDWVKSRDLPGAPMLTVQEVKRKLDEIFGPV